MKMIFDTKHNINKPLVIILLFAAVIILYAIVSQTAIFARTMNFENYANNSRFTIWEYAMNGFYANPIIGSGVEAGSYYSLLGTRWKTHSCFVDIITGQGLIGVALVGLMFVEYLRVQRDNRVFMGCILLCFFLPLFSLNGYECATFWMPMMICRFLYVKSREYDDIFAAWDWHKAPGTTVETKPFDEVKDGGNRYHSSESYRVNGVSDGNNGATAMELIHEGLSAKKAWFMFDDEVVALGADITLKGGKYSAISTVNQSLLKTDAVIGTATGKTAILTAKSDETHTPLWAIQDSIGYVFDGKSKVHITAKEQSGDRYDIDWNYATTRPEKTNIITRDVFTLWFDHTADKTSTYEYTIVPNVTQDELKEYASAKPVRVLSNTGKLQAVEHTLTGEKQAIFWTPGTANFEGISVSVDKEVLIAISGSGDEQRLAISSLAHKVEQVTVVVNKDGVESEYVVDLPGERYTGSSLIVNLSTGVVEK